MVSVGGRLIVAKKIHVVTTSTPSGRKSLTSNRTQLKTIASTTSPTRIEFAVRPADARVATARHIDFKVLPKAPMHFGFYLMIAALLLMGVEVGYALYQLATFVL